MRLYALNESPVNAFHVAAAPVLLRDIGKILFHNNPVNVPVIK